MNVIDLIDVLDEQGAAWLLYMMAGVFGACMGSFLQACYFRIPCGRSITWPGSSCPQCRTLLAWHDNLPIVGWLILMGHCRTCRVKIPFRYLWMEMVCALWPIGLLAFHLRERLSMDAFLLIMALGYVALLMASIDVRTKVLPDAMTLTPLYIAILMVEKDIVFWSIVYDKLSWFHMLNVLIFMVILLTWRGLLRSWVWILAGADAADHVDVFFESSSLYSKVMKCLVWVVMTVGSIFIVTQVNPFDFAGPVLMLSLFVVTRWLGQAMTGQEALGLGDVKLAMTIGWFSGVDGGLLACGLACCSGTAEALCRSGLDLKKDFAFGSHLCGAWMIVMLWQQLL